MFDEVEDEFKRGVNAYWGGEIADGWDDEARRAHSPYIMGWYMASMWETMPGYLTDEDGDPLQGLLFDEDEDESDWDDVDDEDDARY